jgi:GNAT superfamily N-acetyltransferase
MDSGSDTDQDTGLRLVRVGWGHPDALALIEAVQEEYVVRYGGRDDTPLDPVMFDPPRGSFFVGYADDVPVVSGAWRRRDDVEAFGTSETAEIKRMFVVREARGAGHARTVLAHLERTAAAAGARAMVLETGDAQPEAIALYTSSGYSAIPSFGHYRWSPQNRCFAKRLPGSAADLDIPG